MSGASTSLSVSLSLSLSLSLSAAISDALVGGGGGGGYIPIPELVSLIASYAAPFKGVVINMYGGGFVTGDAPKNSLPPVMYGPNCVMFDSLTNSLFVIDTGNHVLHQLKLADGGRNVTRVSLIDVAPGKSISCLCLHRASTRLPQRTTASF